MRGLGCPLESGSPLLKARSWTPEQQARDEQSPLSPPMTERQWELYRLSVVDQWPESAHKAAVIAAIKHKLITLARQEKASIDLQDSPTSTPQPHKVTP
jgi:hypothetical protein